MNFTVNKITQKASWSIGGQNEQVLKETLTENDRFLNAIFFLEIQGSRYYSKKLPSTATVNHYREPIYREPLYSEPLYREPGYREPVYREPIM